MKPVIGIPGNTLTPYENRELNIPLSYTPHGFVERLQVAGALSVVFPISAQKDARQYVQSVDAIVLAGGQDVSPFAFGEEPSVKLGATNPKRDAFEFAVIEEAIKEKKPVLAVCRGMQVYNVALGGTLYQDLSFYPNLSVQHVQKTTPKTAVHSINIDKDSWISRTYGEKAFVNSYHHQAIHKLADGLKATAWSKDGLIEAFEKDLDGIHHIAVQWHPEFMERDHIPSQQLFNDFVNYVCEVTNTK